MYLTALKLEGATASAIAKEEGLKRTTIYPILKSMADKGFISIYFRKNKRFYYAVKPNKIQQLFEKKVSDFNQIIPFLNSLSKTNSEVIGLRFIETLGELKNFYDNLLVEYSSKKSSEREYYIIGNAISWEGMEEEYFKQFRKERAKLEIRTKLILSEDSKKINPLDEKLLRQFRYCPAEYKFKSTIDIYSDKILIVSPQLSSLAVVIAIPAMVDIFGSIFGLLWDNLN